MTAPGGLPPRLSRPQQQSIATGPFGIRRRKLERAQVTAIRVGEGVELKRTDDGGYALVCEAGDNHIPLRPTDLGRLMSACILFQEEYDDDKP